MASHKRDTAVWIGLLLILIFTPLPAASISPLAQALLTFALYTLLAISYTLPPEAVNIWPMATKRRYRLLMVCWTLAMAFAFFQVIPIPPALSAGLSPALSDLYAWTLPTGSQPGHWRSLSTTPAATIQNGLLIGAYAAAFALVVRHCKTRRRMLILTMTMILVGLGEAVFGLSQVGGKLTSPASGTFVNRNHFAAFLIMALGLTMGLILSRWHEDTERSGRSGSSESGIRLDRWTRTSPLFVVSLTLLAAVIFSFSRTGLIASFVIVILFGIFGSLGSLSRFIGFLMVGMGALSVLLITGAWRGFRIVAYRFETIEESYRLAVWKGAYSLFQSFPFVGTGLGSFVDNISRFLPTIKDLFDHAHNEPLEILAEAGVLYAAVVGMGLLIYFATVIPTWFKRRDPLVKGLGWGCLVGAFAVFAFSLVEFPLRMPANALTLSIILGLGWVIVHHRTQEQESRDRQPRTPRPASGPWLILILAIAGMGISGVTALGNIVDRAGDNFMKQADGMTGETQQALLKKASQFYRNAHGIEPWQPAHAFKLGQIFEMTALSLPPISEASRTAWASAADLYKQALFLHPGNARVQAALGWAALQSGDLGEAGRATHAAMKLAPGDSDVRLAVSKWYLVQWEGLSTPDRQFAMELIREGAADLPLEYMKAIWHFVSDLKTIKTLLPEDLKIRRLLLGELTERQLFSDRWAEQDANPSLRLLSPDRGFIVLSYGHLHGRQQLPAESTSGGGWTGMVEGWLSAGLTATSRVMLPPGEVVLFIPVRAEAAGGIWPTLSMTLNGNPIPPLTLAGPGWRIAYFHVYTEGGTFPLQAILTNGDVIRQNGQFAERRASLGPLRLLAPKDINGFRSAAHGHSG